MTLTRRIAAVLLAILIAASGVMAWRWRAGSSPRPVPQSAAVEIPFSLSAQNNLLVAASLNDTDRFTLMLHTASSDVTLTEAAVRNSSSVKFTDAANVKSWGGQADSRSSPGNRLRIGALMREGVRVWENKLAGHGSDGKFGLDFFNGRAVEIDFDRSLVVAHERLPGKLSGLSSLELTTDKGSYFVTASCVIGGVAHPHRFMLHSGYSGGLLLDDAFVAKTAIDGGIKIVEESSLQDSFGNSIKVKKGVLPRLTLGTLEFGDVPVGFFAGAVNGQPISVMGGDVLRRFNMVFDFAGRRLYCLPRTKGA